MNKRSFLIMLWIMMAGTILTLAGCGAQGSTVEPLVMAEGVTPDWVSGPPIPTPDKATPEPPCDEPTWIVGEQKVCRFLVTPLPDEKVRVGAITEFVPPVVSLPQPRYTVREDIPPWQPITRPDQTIRDIPVQKLFVQDSATGHEIRLGDDAGDALFQMMTSQYVIWRYQWNGWAETTRKTGLYAYVLETGEEIVIARKPDHAPLYPEIDGQMVLYTDAKNNNVYFAKLRVHNLATGEDFLLGKKIPYYGRSASDYYALGGGKIAWVEADNGRTVRVYDLATRTTRILNVPNTTSPEMVSISGDIVVWFDKFWRGYDLQQDTLFTIPTVPPGWESVSVQPASPVTVKDDRLYWALSVNDKVYRFTAPIIRDK